MVVWRFHGTEPPPEHLVHMHTELGRVAGETAPILFTVAAFYLPRLPHSPLDQAMALPYHLYIISTQIPNVPENYRYGTAFVLVGLVLVMNIAAVLLRAKFRRKK